MSMPKFKKYYDLMMQKNSELFAKFSPIHDGFAMDTTKFEAQFHQVGRDVVDVIRDWERRLCFGTEKGVFSQYSAGLAEKFWAEVKKKFPLIEQVGVKKS